MVANDYGVIVSNGIEQRQEISKKIIEENRQRELAERYCQQVEACYIYLVGKYKETLTIEKSIKVISDLNRLDVAMAFEMQPIINGILDLLASDEIEEQFNGLRWAVRINLWQSQV